MKMYFNGQCSQAPGFVCSIVAEAVEMITSGCILLLLLFWVHHAFKLISMDELGATL